MDCKDIESKIRFSYYIQFGLFRLADRLLEAEYTNHFSYSKSQHSKKGNKQYQIKDWEKWKGPGDLQIRN